MCSLILASKENHLVLERVLVCPRPQEVAVVRRVDVTAYLGDCGMAMSYTENWLQEVRASPSRCCVHLPTCRKSPGLFFRRLFRAGGAVSDTLGGYIPWTFMTPHHAIVSVAFHLSPISKLTRIYLRACLFEREENLAAVL